MPDTLCSNITDMVRPDADTMIGGQSSGFPPTRPALIRETTVSGHPGREAMSEIAALYWKPVPGFVIGAIIGFLTNRPAAIKLPPS